MRSVGIVCFFFFFSSRRRHTRWTGDWSSDVCSSDLLVDRRGGRQGEHRLALLGSAGLAQDRDHVRDPRGQVRSEERRVGKKGRTRWAADNLKKKKEGK